MLIHELDPFDRPAAAGLREALGKGSFRDPKLAADANARQLPGAHKPVDSLARHVQHGGRLGGRQECSFAYVNHRCYKTNLYKLPHITSARGARIQLLPKGKHRPLTPLEKRHSAALRLLAEGAIDPEEALAAVVWPQNERLSDDRIPIGRQFYSEDVREEIRRRHAAGETLRQLSRRTGIRLGTVKSMVQEGQRVGAKLAKHQELEGTLF